MNKKIIMTIFCFVAFYAFGEDRNDQLLRALSIFKDESRQLYNDEIQRILWGEKDLLDNWLDMFNLARVDKKNLGLLRNMIYARHGYIFKSETLKRHFSKFDWYKAQYDNVDNLLTYVDKHNIELIQEFEKMSENLKNIEWGADKEGIWQIMPRIASGWSDIFVIYKDDRMDYRFSSMRQLALLHALRGVYTIKGNVLLFSVKKIVVSTPGLDLDDEETGAFGLQWASENVSVVTFDPPIVLKFPITPIVTKNLGYEPDFRADNIKETITVGGTDFYKMSDDVHAN